MYLPDEVIVDLILTGYTYQGMQKEVKISNTALFNRLRNFLIYNNINSYDSTNIVSAFRSGNYEKIRHIIKVVK